MKKAAPIGGGFFSAPFGGCLGFPSNHQQCIAIGMHAVLLLHGRLIGLHDQVVPTKSGGEHQQRGLRRVEVGDQGVGQLELVRRKDEPRGPAVIGLELAEGAVGGFHGAHHGSSNGYDFATAFNALVHDVHAILGDDQLL